MLTLTKPVKDKVMTEVDTEQNEKEHIIKKHYERIVYEPIPKMLVGIITFAVSSLSVLVVSWMGWVSLHIVDIEKSIATTAAITELRLKSQDNKADTNTQFIRDMIKVLADKKDKSSNDS